MAKYIVKHECGHEREVILYGPTRDRERKLEWMATIPCPECQKAIAEQHEKERTEEMGLPELTGSEKQIKWATGIRLEKLDILNRKQDDFSDRIDGYNIYLGIEGLPEEKISRTKGRLEAATHNLSLITEIISRLSGITEAHWWIEHRGEDVEGLAKAFKALQEAEMEKAIEAEMPAPAMVTMEPEEKQTAMVAALKVTEKEVLIQSDKDEHIRLTVKKHGFSWDGSRTVWAKPITEMTGPARDIGPDTARILLEAGIPVKARTEIMEAVQSGDYERETKRWVMRSNKERDKLFITKVDGVSLPGGCHLTYNGDGIISPSAWREIREFASLNGYKITRLADEMLRKAEAATVSVKLPDGEVIQATAEDALRAVLESSRDVLEDLKEED